MSALFSLALLWLTIYHLACFHFLGLCAPSALLHFHSSLSFRLRLILYFHLCGSWILAQWFNERTYNTGYFKCISKNLTSELKLWNNSSASVLLVLFLDMFFCFWFDQLQLEDDQGVNLGLESSLTLRRLLVWTYDPKIRLKTLAALVDHCQGLFNVNLIFLGKLCNSE